MGSPATPQVKKLPFHESTALLQRLRRHPEIWWRDYGECWLLTTEICWDELSLTLTAPPVPFSRLSPLLCVWWQTGTSAAVITNLIRAEVRLMTKTVASTALLINSCPIMVLGQRRWAKKDIFFLFPSLSVLLPRSPLIMNSLLGPNYFQGCIRSTAGPVETSAEFLLTPHPPSSLPLPYSAGDGLHLIEFWMLHPPHTPHLL